MVVKIGHTEVWGVGVDGMTRCAHYHGPVDVIALRFKCCGRFYPCRECHDEVAGHTAELWQEPEREVHAVLCGACGTTLSIADYLACAHRCPRCGAAFNPGCALHRHLYFSF
jgi:uncharacterized CHY-type Zn-finger protein